MNLNPAMLVSYSKAGMWEECRKYYIEQCTGKGACVYVCPARIPMLRYINRAKKALNPVGNT